MILLQVVFWLCLTVILWEVLLFPAALWFVARLRPQQRVTAEITPSVSIIITTHNEADAIPSKLTDTLALDYPTHLLEIIVADDASSDDTCRIAETFAANGVRLVRQQPWRGKTAAQNLAMQHVSNEVVLFSDATALYSAGAVRALVRNFADPSVGCVTGRVALGEDVGESNSTTASGLRGRIRYEQGVRRAQGEAFSLFGATGCIYAVRRALYVPMADDQVSDLVLPLLLLERGYRTVYEPEAVATLDRPVSAEREFSRRSRIVLQCLLAMWQMRRLLLPWHAGATVAAIAWYRLLRWLLPLFLLGLLASSVALVLLGADRYMWGLLGQVLLYGLALIGGLAELLRLRLPLLGIPFVFVWINAAAAAALLRALSGEKAATWQTVREARRQ